MLISAHSPVNGIFALTGENTLARMAGNLTSLFIKRSFTMKTRILAGIIFSGALATPVAHAGTFPSIEGSNSGLSAAATRQVQQAAAQQTARNWQHYLNIVQPSGLSTAAAQKATHDRQEAKDELKPLHVANWQHYLNIVQPSGLGTAATQQAQLAVAQKTTHNGQEAKNELEPLHAANWQHYLNIIQS